MSKPEREDERAVREAAYYIWVNEGRPHGRAHDHWGRAVAETEHRWRSMQDEEKILAGRHDANLPALLTQDVPGG
jgi:hypothetical protein